MAEGEVVKGLLPLTLVLAAQLRSGRLDFATEMQTGGPPVVTVSATVAEAESEYRIQVPSGLVQGFVVKTGDRVTETLCDGEREGCISLTTVREAADRPQAIRAWTDSGYFWYLAGESNTDTVRMNAEFLLDGIPALLGKKLQELAVPEVVDARVSRLRDLLSLVLIRRRTAISAQKFRFVAWTASDDWRNRFIRSANAKPSVPSSVEAFEASPMQFLEGYVEAELKRTGAK